MDNKKTKRFRALAVGLLLVVQAAYYLYYCSMKQNMSGDGFFTYVLGNSTGFPALADIIGSRGWTPQEFADHCFSITPETRFNFAQIWENQAGDTHPPLYYLLINILCSIFQPEFVYERSVWLGMIVNIVFALGSTMLVLLCLKKLTKSNPIAYLGALLAAVMPAVVEMTTFVRMYNMANFFVLCIVYWHIRNWDEPLKIKHCLLLLPACVAAFLTHYYTIPFVFCIALWFGIRLLCTHKWKEAGCYAAATIGSMALSVAIFPAMIKHIFMQGRGTQAFENLAESSMFERMFVQANGGTAAMMDTFVLGNLLRPLLGFFAVIGILHIVILCGTKKKWNTLAHPELMLVAAGLVNFLLITKIAAYLSIRYFYFFCVPLVIAIVVLITEAADRYAKRNAKSIVAVAAVCAMVFASAFSVPVSGYSFLVRDTNDHREQMKNDGINTVLYVTNSDGAWQIQNVYRELEVAEHLYFVTTDMLGDLVANGIEAQPFYLYVLPGQDNEIFNATQEALPDVNFEHRYDSGYTRTYYCTPKTGE